MLVRLSLDETHGVGRLRHDVVRGGGVAYMRTYNTPSTLNSLSPCDSWSLVLWYVLLWYYSGTTLVLLWYYSGRHDDMTTGGTVSRMDGRTEGGGRWMGRWKERD